MCLKETSDALACEKCQVKKKSEKNRNASLGTTLQLLFISRNIVVVMSVTEDGFFLLGTSERI